MVQYEYFVIKIAYKLQIGTLKPTAKIVALETETDIQGEHAGDWVWRRDHWPIRLQEDKLNSVITGTLTQTNHWKQGLLSLDIRHDHLDVRFSLVVI